MVLTEMTKSQESYLRPLAKWRVMRLADLQAEYDFKPNYKTFCRTIKKLEAAGHVQSFRRSGLRDKYLYLTPKGDDALGLGDAPAAVFSETLLHDLKVSELARLLRGEGWFHDIKLEHELHNRRQVGALHRVLPDALLEGVSQGKSFKIALELEINSKSHIRIQEKVRQYNLDSSIDYVLYVFERERQLHNYHELLNSSLGKEAISRLMFFCWNKEHPVGEARGIFRSEQKSLAELFGRLRSS